MNITDAIKAAVAKAGYDDSLSTELKISEPQHGDLQLNGCLAYAKAHKMNPREVAQKLVDALDIDKEAVRVSIAGPGFVNFAFTPKALAASVREIKTDSDLSPKTRVGQKIVLDYGSPNAAKQMHIGNLRSYNIGEAIYRLLKFCGAQVHRDNHLGDWGTSFGYIIYGLKQNPKIDLETDPLGALDNLYKEWNQRAKEDPDITEGARAEVAKLQAGDPENIALWKKVIAITLEALEVFHRKLGIEYDSVYGESYYNDKVERVYQELTELGIAKEDEGALVVFHPEHSRYKEQPFIIRKRDGAANYGSTDLATILYKAEHMQADAAYYVVDARQSDHFEQLFLTANKWFAAKKYRQPELKHLTFGTILGEDGRPIKTRSGESVKLADVLDEAVERARKIVDEKNPSLPESERAQIAQIVGIGAVRYADLAQNRTSDYQFSWDKLLAMEGNTAPYLMYAIARINSIFEKLNRSADEGFSSVETLTSEGEIALARKLIQAPTWIALAASDLRPHHLCTYLYELAGVFGGFYNADRISGEAQEVVERRLMLCAKTKLTLEMGMRLLGLATVKRM